MPPLTWDSGLHWNTPGLFWDGVVNENNNNTPMQNKVSAALAAQAIANIHAAIATIRENAPFLTPLTKEERQSLPRAGDGSQAFLQASLTFAAQHPEALPANFNAVEFAKDGALYFPFMQLMAAIEQLNEDFLDTGLAFGSDFFLGGLDVYAFAKANNRGGMYDTYVDAAKVRFTRRANRPPTPPTP